MVRCASWLLRSLTVLNLAEGDMGSAIKLKAARASSSTVLILLAEPS